MLTHERIVEAIEKAAREFPLTKVSYWLLCRRSGTEESDLDLLVEFEQPAVSILTVIKLKHYLEEELAKPIDVIHAPLPQGSIVEIGKAVSIL